jgi:hypothetical protein
MDNDLLFLQNLLLQHWLEVEHEKEFQDQLWLAAAVLIVRLNEDHAWAIENRHPRQQYLRRPNLLPNPWFGTPWRRLYERHKDCAFITTMGVDTATFCSILEAGFGSLWYSHTIPRTDTHTAGHPQAGRRSVDAEGGLGLVLHWLSSTMPQVSLQQIFALVPSTVSRYLRFALSILIKVLRQMPSAVIAWP